MIERWKTIETVPAYEVSNLGQIRRKGTTKPMFQRVHPKKGYLEIQLSTTDGRKWFRVHRLVALAWVPNPLGLPEVNHKRGDKTNCRASALEWIGRSENEKHKTRVIRTHANRVTAIFVHPEHGKVKVGNLTEFAEHLGVSPSSVSAVACARRKTVCGWSLHSRAAA